MSELLSEHQESLLTTAVKPSMIFIRCPDIERPDILMTDDDLQLAKPQRISLSQQTHHYLLGLIKTGTYRPGDQLPPQSELADQLGVSRLTLREALLALEQEGVVILKHGVGTFVSPNYRHWFASGLERLESILELATRQDLQVECRDLQVESELAVQELAERFGVETGAPLTRICRAIAVGETLVAYMCDVVPASILSPTDMDDTFEGSVLELLRNKLGLPIAQAVANITAICADDNLTRTLRVPSREALLLLEETLFDEDGRVVGYSRNYFVPKHFRFHVVRR
jgi:GntR family transcriptional regulator